MLGRVHIIVIIIAIIIIGFPGEIYQRSVQIDEESFNFA